MYIIIVDLRDFNGQMTTLIDDNGFLQQFKTYEDAELCFLMSDLNTYPVKYVNMDE